MYDVCNGTGPNTSATLTLTVGSGSAGSPQGAASGDLVVVCAGSNAGGAQVISSVTDSKSNTYVQQVFDNGVTNQSGMWTTLTGSALVAGTDTITITWSTVSGQKVAVVKGNSGVTSATADQAVHASASSTAPNSGSTGVLSQASEVVVGVICSAGSGGQPAGLSSGGGGTTAHSAGTGYLCEFNQVVSATTALSMSGTLPNSANWCCLAATFKQSSSGALTVTSTSPPAASKGTSYTFNFSATGGTGSGYTWSVQMGSSAGPSPNTDGSTPPVGYYFPPGLQFSPSSSGHALGAVITGVTGGSSGLAAEYTKWATAPSSGYGIYPPAFNKIYGNTDLAGWPVYATAALWKSNTQHIGAAMTNGFKMILCFNPTAKGTSSVTNWPSPSGNPNIFPSPSALSADWTSMQATINSIQSACTSLANGSGIAAICLWNESDGPKDGLLPYQASYQYKYFYPLLKAAYPHIPVCVNWIHEYSSTRFATMAAWQTDLMQRFPGPSPLNPSGWGDGKLYCDGLLSDNYGEGFDSGNPGSRSRYWYAEAALYTPPSGPGLAGSGNPGVADIADYQNITWGNIETGNSASGGAPTNATIQDYLIGAEPNGNDVNVHSMWATVAYRLANNLPFFGSSWYENLGSTGPGHITTAGDYRISCLNSIDALASACPTGQIIGTPTQNGTYPMTLVVEDSGGNVATAAVSIVVGTGALALGITTPAGALNDGTGGQDYGLLSVQIGAQGGTTPYTFTINSGTLSGSGLTLNSSGTITGTCAAVTTATTYTFTVKVTDHVAATAISGTLTITVNPGATTLAVTTTALGTGTVGTAYSYTLLCNGGGTGTGYTWTQTGTGSLTGSGISLSSGGVLSGSTPVLGTYPNLKFTVTDSGSNTATSAAMTLTVGSSLPTLAVTTTALGGGTTGTAYSFQLQSNGGGTGAGYTWTLNSGSLAGSGIALSSGGLLSGATPVAGTYSSLVFKVTDSGAHTALSGSLTLTVTTAAATVVITTPDPLAGGTTGVPYADVLSAAGGTGPYTFTLAPGSPPLPPGLLIDNTDPLDDESGSPVTDEAGAQITSEGAGGLYPGSYGATY